MCAHLFWGILVSPGIVRNALSQMLSVLFKIGEAARAQLSNERMVEWSYHRCQEGFLQYRHTGVNARYRGEFRTG